MRNDRASLAFDGLIFLVTGAVIFADATAETKAHMQTAFAVSMMVLGLLRLIDVALPRRS